MTSSKGARHKRESRASGSQIQSMLTLAVVPLIVLSLVVGGLLVYYLVISDGTSGFSIAEIAAILIGLVVLAVTIRSLMVIRRTAGILVNRVEEVTKAAQRVADQDLTELVDALAMPDPSKATMTPLELNTDGPIELADLAKSLEGLHSSLGEVASRQMETLKGGVSSLIVTLARRNASLIDRQLGHLDDLESQEDDPEILGTYFTLDHLATRMRRNAESLLVLAGEPPPRVWARSMEMADVVRAAVSEIDEYQRIEIVTLEPALLAGGAVADVAHLLAELMENATRFSPPSEPVKVSTVFDLDGYQLSITDRGVGVTNEKVEQLNRTLRNPPALGLALEPTMGIYVVSKLAARHGIDLELIPGIPGLIARVTIPRHLLEASLTAPPIHREFSKPAESDPRPERQAVAEKADHVIDLTETSMTGSLPVRSPGQTLDEGSMSQRSVVEGESAIGIKSALAAYDQGRRAAGPAQGAVEAEDESGTEEGIS
ncbi:MAG: hypothetical protein U9N56_07685 [Actinomycetota bacterium]|nr:hypothetical protein [Actinomycetota bacterium]